MATRFLRGLGTALLLAGAAGCDSPLTASDPGSSPGTATSSESKIAADVSRDVSAGQARDVLVLLSDQTVHIRRAAFRAAIPAENFDAYLQTVKGDLDEIKGRVLSATQRTPAVTLRNYDHLPVLNLRVDSPEALAALEANPEVVRVAADQAMFALGTPSVNLTQVGQPTVAASGKLGANTAVAVLDTGTDYKRAPFNCTAPGQPASCPVAFAKDFAVEDNALDTGSYHGTNVAGIVNAVAPSAKILALDVFDGDSAWTSTILLAINWCVQNKAKYNIVAINLSLGGGIATSVCASDPFAPALATARAAGILTAVASGNSASAAGLASPACTPAAVSVGAVYSANVGGLATSVCTDKTTATDQVACFSNSASFLTVLAPGVGITAAGITMSGTSQATPHVAGAIALLASAYPTATPDALVARLTTSKTTVTDVRNNVKKPRLDLVAALASTPATVPPTPAPTGTVTINGGAKYTKSTGVTVSVTTTSGTATQICLSATTTCTAWKAYVASNTWTLATGDGAKPVYVWWKNADGVASANPTSASIVLDTTAPSNGALLALLSGSSVTLVWAGAVDLGSGVASYKLVSQTGAVPADCSKGTTLYSGTAVTYKSAALPAGTTYFRLCATDNIGNTSVGATTSVKVTGK